MSLLGGVGSIVGGVVDGVGDIVGGVVDGVEEILPDCPPKEEPPVPQPPEEPVVPPMEEIKMCTQTGLNPNRRTVVAAFAWILQMRNGAEMDKWWVDMSVCGLAWLDQYRAELSANADHSNGTISFPVSQYHVYYEDGGRARPQILYDMQQIELKSNRYYPERGPKTFAVVPEYWIQEGITENPYYVVA